MTTTTTQTTLRFLVGGYKRLLLERSAEGFVTPTVFAVLITFFSGLLTLRVSTAEAPENAAVAAR